MQRRPFIARIAFVAIAALLLFSCTRRPAEPQFNNPFDPATGGGDPFRLTAEYTTLGVVALTWHAPPVTGITDYHIRRSVQPAGPYTVTVIPATAAAVQITTDAKFARNRTNYYRVLAFNGHDINAESQVVAATVSPPAKLTILRTTTAFNDSTVPSRQARLVLRSNFGDSVEVASTRSFLASQRFAATDTNTIIPWDLGAASARHARLRVFARMHASGVVSTEIVGDSALADLTAKVRLVGAVINDTLIVRANGLGFTRLRAVGPGDSLELAPWLANPHPERTDSIEVRVVLQNNSLAPFVVRAEAESDFGFTRRYDLPAVPLSVDTLGLTFTINNAAGHTAGDAETTHPDVFIVSTAKNATQMRFSESTDFTGVPWQPFRTTSTFTLLDTAGTHRVYGIFRNPFEPHGFAVSKSIVLLAHSSAAR